MSSNSIHLVSVNKTPARAAVLVGQLLESLSNEYDIIHVANSSTIQELGVVLKALVHPPGALICSSQWSTEEHRQVKTITKALFPDMNIINIPPGLDQREGSEGIIAFLKGAVLSSGIQKR